MTTQLSLAIETMDPKQLKPYPKNPKLHPPEQIKAIARSIKEFGFDQPIVVDPDLEIIKGHGRYLAAMELGLDQVPVVVKQVSKTDAKLHRVLDNRVQSDEWDVYALRMELLELQQAGALELTLFTEDLIPQGDQYQLNVATSDFLLATRHECPQCKYTW